MVTTFFIAFWLSLFLFVFGLLGINMYTLLVLADLEHDYINPHDATRRVNATVLPECYVIAAVLIMLLFSGNISFCIMMMPIAIFKLYKYKHQTIRLDVTEIFNVIPLEKKQRCETIDNV